MRQNGPLALIFHTIFVIVIVTYGHKSPFTITICVVATIFVVVTYRHKPPFFRYHMYVGAGRLEPPT